MDVLVLSHATARLFHNAPHPPASTLVYPRVQAPFACAAPNIPRVSDARKALVACGIPSAKLTSIDVMVAKQDQKRSARGVRCHLWSHDLPANSLIELEQGIYVAGVELCALQAATYMNELELIEYYYELCSTYCMPLADSESYRDLKTPRTTTRKLRRFFHALPPRSQGRRRALRALAHVRDGSRSPLESAMVMTVACPQRLGGLGISDICMNYSVPVTARARALTRRSKLICDAFIKQGAQDLEYHGFFHDEDEQKAIDNERRQAMQAMGYTTIEVIKQQFFDTIAYRRVLAAIRLNAGLPDSPAIEGFDEKQEALRQFVLRRWLDEAE